MKYRFWPQRDRRGFTLMELLIVVSIIIILSFIAIPNIIAAQRQLQMAKLDEFARQIYLEAQNEAIKMKASGRLETCYSELETRDDWSLRVLNFQPPDYVTGDITWRQLYYVPSGNIDGFSNTYFVQTNAVLSDATELGGSFILEMNPLTGDIYSAFYKEGALNYSEIMNLEDRSQEKRSSISIGYYSGNNGDLATTLPRKFVPSIVMHNEEELWAEITCPDMIQIVGTQRKLTLRVTAEDEDGNSWSREYKGGSDFVINDDTARVKVVLDSFVDIDKSFAGVTGGLLIPGQNITVKAEFLYSNNDINIAGDVTSEAVNSLFGSRALTEDGILKVEIGYVRHLNNLRESKCEFPSVGKGEISIVQTDTIDFDKRYVGTDASSGVESFEPINNSKLFDSAIKTAFNGNGNKLQNFIINTVTDSKENGLILHIGDNCTLENIRLVDFIVGNGEEKNGAMLPTDSTGYVGALAGYVGRSTVKNCGVYLSTKGDYGRHDNMEERVKKYRVMGALHVGGLIGGTRGSTIVNCFSAVEVTGVNTAGGLVGYAAFDSKIVNCYSSENVASVSGNAGGLVGLLQSSSGENGIYDSYSTSNVTGQTAGGLVGEVTEGDIEKSHSYGKVTGSSQEGGFVGHSSNGKFKNCSYLMQIGYNEKMTVFAGIKEMSYQDLKLNTANLPVDSNPYSDKLTGKIFPFKMLKDGAGATMIHHGDWPLEVKIKTSLIYYEKYENPDKTVSYGYYAQTSLLNSDDGMPDTEGGKINKWTLDTLQDRSCVEDGYALMSIYELGRFDYTLNLDLNPTTPLQTVIVREGDREDSAKLIASKAALIFKTKVNVGTAAEEEVEYLADNAYIYRLPFNLQLTKKTLGDKDSRFYDQLKVTGYVADAGSYNEVFKDYIFYYCPDFAKNAINPSLNDTDAICPKDPDRRPGKNGEPPENPYVYVRSARQLNALGRTTYYWNSRLADNSADKDREFYFLQENDIDFGRYVKGYCGVDQYDLMDTSKDNKYRNLPIGRTNNQYGFNFRYVYDGGGNKIIDYCCVTYEDEGYDTNGKDPKNQFQFTGLFGEIQYATLKNIHMVASDPENRSGFVESHYIDFYYPWDKRSAGVGALVGLVYVSPDESYDGGKLATVQNCSVSGYDVSYTVGSAQVKISVGGLAGYNFGRIENCSAVNRTVRIESNNANGQRVLAAGLVGSIEGMGTIKNCYSAAKLQIKLPNAATDSRVAGICGGNMKIYGYPYPPSSLRPGQITDSYSYCTWDKNVISLSGMNDVLYPVAPSAININNCYYLADTVGPGIVFKEYSANNPGKLYLSQLSGENGLKLFNRKNFGMASAYDSFPWPADEEALYGLSYPFPAVVRHVDEKGDLTDFIHYGSWPDATQVSAGAYLCYYEEYDNGTYGLYYFSDGGDDQTPVRRLNDSETVKKSGYGILCADKNFDFLYDGNDKNYADVLTNGNQVLEITPVIEAAEVLKIDTALPSGFAFYEFNDAYKNSFVGKDGKNSVRPLLIKYQRKSDNAMVNQDRYINAYYGANIYSTDDRQSLSHSAEIRTAENLKMLKKFSDSYDGTWTFRQTSDILIEEKDSEVYGLIQNNRGYHYDGGGRAIFGLRWPMFETNSGSVSNLMLRDVKIRQDGDAAALALINEGQIENSLVTGSVVSNKGNAAGLAVVHRGAAGEISSSYVNCDVSGLQTAGFVYANDAVVKNCYASGLSSSTAPSPSASGFFHNGAGSVRNSYSIVRVEGGVTLGFGPTQNDGRFSNCFWVSTSTFNSGFSQNDGATLLDRFSDLKLYLNNLNDMGPSTWTLDNKNHTHPSSPGAGDYPYPRLSSLDHYGDWPS